VAEGGTRREGGLANQRRRPAQCFNDFLRRTVAQRSAWRGAEAHESGARWSALRAEECGNEGVEERSESKVEWVAFGGCHEKRRDSFSHGPTARRGDARGDGCMRRAWSKRSGQSVAPA
jgi:hypothetical protein